MKNPIRLGRVVSLFVICFLLLLGLFIGRLVFQPRPRIEFLRFQDTADGKMAIFQMRNDSSDYYSYFGDWVKDYDQLPGYYLGSRTGLGWHRRSIGTQYSMNRLLSPGGVKAFSIPRNLLLPGVEFRVGIAFMKGHPEAPDFGPKKSQYNLIWWIFEKLIESPIGSEDQVTWSPPVLNPA